MIKHRILFICHGNICRSPMAEVIFRDMVAKRGLSDCFDISSRATSAEEIRSGVGNPVNPPARMELARHGLSCDGMRARLLTREDCAQYDLLIGMDVYNLRNTLRTAGGDPDGKIRKLMDYTPRGGDVADPWYTGEYGVAYLDIFDGCTGLFNALLAEDTGVDKTNL